MRILLTGKSGFIGSYIDLSDHEVFYLNRTNVDEISDFGPELVINLAWEGVFNNDSNIQNLNIALNERLFSLCERTCRRWIGIGSQIEINKPEVLYASCKLQVKKMLEEKCSNIQFAWIRIYSIYGPRANPNNYIPYLIRELKAGKNPELTDQNIPWDYLYAKDAAEAILKIAFSEETGVFELGSGETVLTQDVAKLIRDKINPHAILQFGKKPKREVELNYLCADITRLKKIGWKPTTSLDEGLNNTIL